MAELRAGSTVGGYKILTMACASDILEALKTVDGAGSGLDADARIVTGKQIGRAHV